MSMKADRELEAMQSVFAAMADLTPEEQRRVLDWLSRKLGLSPSSTLTSLVTPSSGHIGAAGPKQGGQGVSAKQFMTEKRPRTEVERVVCLAYYLSLFRDTPSFNTKDISLLNRESAQPPLTNAARAVSNATYASQMLVPTGGGRKQITTRGEALVEALPDRERVREALDANPMVGRKRRTRMMKRDLQSRSGGARRKTTQTRRER